MKVFDNVSIRQMGDLTEISIGDYSETPITEGYDISINLDDRTYLAISKNDEEMDLIVEKFRNNRAENNDLSLSSVQWAIYGVTVTTDDPIGADLTETHQAIYWFYDGSKVYFQDRTGSCWAANPSLLLTHWYIDSCYYSYFGILDGRRTIASSIDASYHNWDFGWNDQRTDVSHHIYIEAYCNGGVYNHVTWTKSGEGSSLLDLDKTTVYLPW